MGLGWELILVMHAVIPLDPKQGSMTVLDNSAVGFDLEFDELFNDTSKCRAVLQNNEDKIEEFNKWSENMVRFVKTILEEASSMLKLTR